MGDDDVLRELRCLSGGAGSRGNAWMVSSANHHVLLDCGAAPDGGAAWLPTQAPDATFISHAHWDHGAALGLFFQRFPTALVYATRETRSQLKGVLGEVLGGASHSARRDRAAAIVDSVRPAKFHEPIMIGDLEVVFLPAGHVPGAAMLRVDCGETRVIYTSDFCMEDQHSVVGASAVDWACDIVVVEGAVAGDKRFVLGWREAAWETIAGAVNAGPTLIGVSPYGSALEVAMGLRARGIEPLLHQTLSVEGFDSGPMSACERVLKVGGVVLAPSEGFAAGSPSAALFLGHVTNGSVHCVLLDSRTGLGAAIAKTPRRSKFRWAGHDFGRLKLWVHRVPWTNHATRAEILAAVSASGASRVVLTHNGADALHHVRRALLKAYPGLDVMVAAPDFALAL